MHVVRLKVLLDERRWSSYGTFCREYDRAAAFVDRKLMGGYPSRAQLYRWTTGELRKLPHPHHRQVLERMFPGWTADQIFEIVPDIPAAPPTAQTAPPTEDNPATRVVSTVAEQLAHPGGTSGPTQWGPSAGSTPTRRISRSSALTLPDVSGAVDEDADDAAGAIGRRLLNLGQVLRLTDEEVQQLASLAGQIIDLSLRIDIDIAPSGKATVTYRYHLLNLTSGPLARLTRDLWFQHTHERLALSPLSESEHRIAVRRIHDAGSLAKFACQISPPVNPGETVHVGYTATGGLFKDALYWRQETNRFTREITLNVRHRGAGQLAECIALEEYPDGTENSFPAGLTWDHEDVLMTATFDYLRPDQAVTIRWELDREPA